MICQIKKTIFSIVAVTVSLTTLSSVALPIGFADHSKAIDYVFDNGAMWGKGDGDFGADDFLNRAELVKIIVDLSGEYYLAEDYGDCFPDVNSQWFAPYVCYAKEKGWVSGFKSGEFEPSTRVKKAEALKMLIESEEGSFFDDEAYVNLFDDVESGNWYISYLNLARRKGVLPEIYGDVLPGSRLTRADFAEILYRRLRFEDVEFSSSTIEVDGEVVDATFVSEGRLNYYFDNRLFFGEELRDHYIYGQMSIQRHIYDSILVPLDLDGLNENDLSFVFAYDADDPVSEKVLGGVLVFSLNGKISSDVLKNINTDTSDEVVELLLEGF